MARFRFGWIMALNHLGDKGPELREMGVVLGPFDHRTQIYNNCKVSDRAFVHLLKQRGRFIWHLKSVDGKEEVNPP